MFEQDTTDDFSISYEKCSHCEHLLTQDQIDPTYTGALATYKDNKCCTLNCIDVPEDYE